MIHEGDRAPNFTLRSDADEEVTEGKALGLERATEQALDTGA
ncbi:MAG: hypothetical protein ACXVRK_03460 [Gaiellaceae bacterium]